VILIDDVRYLGVDFGDARIGLALSDAEGKIAFPHGVVEGATPLDQVERVASLAHQHGVEAVVVGCPRGLSGEAGPAEKKVTRFAGRLSSKSLRVVLWDERFTTHGARSALEEQGVSARDQKPLIDQVAATLILQSYLDHLNSR
jgi:putative Holliday junction resolvase